MARGRFVRLRLIGLFCLVANVGLVRSARSSDPPPAPASSAHKSVVPNIGEKLEGAHVTGLPLFNYGPSTGFGFGVGGYYTVNGTRTDPFFAYTPYRRRIFLQAFATTGGYQQHVIAFDGINLGDTPYRLRASLMYEHNTHANYFGVGEATLGPLRFQGVPFSTYAAQVRAASALQAGGIASPNYDNYSYDRPNGGATLERDLLGGWVRVQYGFRVEYRRIAFFDGQKTVGVDAQGRDVDAIHGPTKVGIDCLAHAIVGCDGGWNNILKAAIALDTRDFEPDPHAGVFVDATGEWSARALGSAATYLRLTMVARFYVAPLSVAPDLVLAVRLLYSVQSRGTPFFTMNTLAMTESDQRGLGGETTLRGYRQNRFVAAVDALANLELRWTFARFAVHSKRFSLQFAPLVDVGRVFDRVDLSASQWKPAYGAGLRLGWNQSTIIIFDLGVSREDLGFFVDFGMPF
jgi:outer membrane protein assembly factor BamA